MQQNTRQRIDRRPRNEPGPRLHRHRAAGHLGQQAAIVHDGARQHRGGHVDRHGRHADPGHERDGGRRHRQRHRRGFVHDPAPCRRSSTRTTRSGRATTRSSRSTRPRRSARFSPLIASVAAQASQNATRLVSNRGSRQRPDSRRHELPTATFRPSTPRRGRMMSQVEVDRGQPVAILGWDARGPPVRRDQSARQDHQDRRDPFPRRRRQREEGIVLRQLAGQLRRDPARRLSTAVRRPAVAAADGQADVHRTACRPPWTTPRWRCASRAG